MIRSPTWGLALALVWGCLPDVDRYRIGAGDSGSPLHDADTANRSDGAFSDARAPTDGATIDPNDSGPIADTCSPPVTCAGDCGKPWLLAAVEDIETRPGGQRCGGRIWRWSLQPSGQLCACAGLSGSGVMDPLLTAVSFVPPSTVATTARSGQVLATDGDTDVVRWSQRLTLDTHALPEDLVAVDSLDGARNVLVAISSPSTTDRIFEYSQFRIADGVGSSAHRPDNDLNPISMTQDPGNRRQIRLAHSGGRPRVVDFDLWNDMSAPAFLFEAESLQLFETVYAMHDGTYFRTVVTGRHNGSRIFHVAQLDDSNDIPLPTGEYCARRASDGSNYDIDCDFLHAVPDPHSSDALFAICRNPDMVGDNLRERRIVRLDGLECTDVVSQSSVGLAQRIVKLAIAAESLWSP